MDNRKIRAPKNIHRTYGPVYSPAGPVPPAPGVRLPTSVVIVAVLAVGLPIISCVWFAAFQAIQMRCGG